MFSLQGLVDMGLFLQNSKKIKLDNNRLTFMTDDGKTLTFKEM